LATGFRLSDPREYRRGVVLGLTLAEVLVLLVFLLLLSMSALLLRKEREQGLLRRQLDHYVSLVQSVTRTLASQGVAVDDDGLANLVKAASETETLRSPLEEARALLAAEKAVTAQASAERERLAALLERVPGTTSETLSEKLDRLVRKGAANDAAMANLTGQNTQMRIELARLKGNGGSGLPYCWATSDGRAQYMLKVEMQDDGVVVHNIEPRVRPEDPAWLTLDPIARDQLMPLANFMAQVVPLQSKAAADRCKYAIEVVDGTGRTNKPGYKQLMGRLWTAFNLHEVPR
jgi:hypothetical protein